MKYLFTPTLIISGLFFAAAFVLWSPIPAVVAVLLLASLYVGWQMSGEAEVTIDHTQSNNDVRSWPGHPMCRCVDDRPRNIWINDDNPAAVCTCPRLP